MMLSRIMNPVMVSGLFIKSNRPDTGSQPKFTANRIINIRPSQNLGKDTPTRPPT